MRIQQEHTPDHDKDVPNAKEIVVNTTDHKTV